MNINVTKDNVTITEQEQVHKGEYNVTDLQFNYSEEYTGLSKMAVFSNAFGTYEVAITNNTCIIPHEVLTQKAPLTIGVYGYTTENDIVTKRYSPAPITIQVANGSYKNGQNAQEQSPDLFEEFVEQIESNFDEIQAEIETKQDEITSDNKLPSDLVDDTNQTNLFVTSAEKTTWNNKSDFSGDYNDLANKPTIPTKTSQLTNNSGFIDKDVSNLTNYELKTNTGSTIAISIDSSTYVVTIGLKNSAGTIISSGTIDLPLESVVVDGRYDNITKSLILVLDNGHEVTIPIGDLISGLVPTNRTIAGVDLVDNITKQELQNALDWSDKENVSNKVTSITSSSTNTQYPSAKAVYNLNALKYTKPIRRNT